MRQQSRLTDIALAVAVTVLGGVALYGTLVPSVPRAIPVISVIAICAVAVAAVWLRFINRPDHVRAQQSESMLDVANESLSYLRQGLTAETAQAVCRIALAHTEAAAVAITDTADVLGFAGLGEDHHSVGRPILTRANYDALETGQLGILETPADIGCPVKGCLLKAAIVVPLTVRETPVGTLKFYYTTPRLLNETQTAMAEGLAELLSTQIELSELERQTELATRMELKALQAQIHPHFLFNTLNTIASLIRTDPPRARELVREFAAYYRRILESADELVPLARELDYLHMYLHFEQARFGDMLDFSQAISPEFMDLHVPSFLLQPIVENCVQHGRSGERALCIRLSAERVGDDVVLRVADDGVGMPEATLARVLEPGFGQGLGIALKNVDDRVRGHFGPGSGVTVESVDGAGTTVSLRLAGAWRKGL